MFRKNVLVMLIWFCLIFTVFISSPNLDSANAAIPDTLGWYQIPNTTIRPHCPTQPAGLGDCYSVVSWSGGVFDKLRNRLIIWGGGHDSYYGNEIYALNLNTLTMSRITDPGSPLACQTSDPACCVAAIANGTQPNSRHTYDGTAYIDGLDKMWIFSGAMACQAGWSKEDTWLFDFSTLTWERKYPSGTVPGGIYGNVASYDKNTGLVFLNVFTDTNPHGFFSYNPNTNVYTQLNGNSAMNYHSTSVIDPVRKKFIIIGGGQQWVIDIAPGSNYAQQALGSTGGSAVVNTEYPGLAYDPVSDRIVAWVGGNTVYVLNMDTRQWTPVTYSGGPGAAVDSGTYKRWSYSSALGVFVVYNNVDSNAYTLRLTSGTPLPPDTQAPTTPTNLSATTISSSQINLSWTASTDAVGVTGYRIYRGSTQVATTTVNSYSDTGLSPSTPYSYYVTAYDGAGNVSGQSNTASATTQVAPPPGSALVASYSFNEGTGTTILDSSGNGNSGTTTGASRTTQGKFGGALTFNGLNNWVTINDSSSLDLTSGMTLEAWVYPSVTQSGWRTIVQKQADAYFLHASSDGGALVPGAGGTFGGALDTLTASTSLSVNAWSHLALTYDGSTLRLYVNGVQASSRSRTGTLQSNGNPLRIGGNSTYGEYFQGTIDEVRIYNRALSSAEIQTDMNTSIGGGTPPDATPPQAPTILRVQ